MPIKKKSPEQVKKAIAEKAIHRKIKPREDTLIKDETYSVQQSKTMHKCPACQGEPDLVRECTLCNKKGVIRDKALQRKVKKRDDFKPSDNPLWVAFMRFTNGPTPTTEAELTKLLKEKVLAEPK